MCLVGVIFLCSLDIIVITLANKVLVHVVLPKYEVVSVEFLLGSASHMSIHVN